MRYAWKNLVSPLQLFLSPRIYSCVLLSGYRYWQPCCLLLKTFFVLLYIFRRYIFPIIFPKNIFFYIQILQLYSFINYMSRAPKSQTKGRNKIDIIFLFLGLYTFAFGLLSYISTILSARIFGFLYNIYIIIFIRRL